MIFDKNEIIAFSKFFKIFKELFDLIMSKISSDGGDFPLIIVIALIYSFLLINSVNYKPMTDKQIDRKKDELTGNVSCCNLSI